MDGLIDRPGISTTISQAPFQLGLDFRIHGSRFLFVSGELDLVAEPTTKEMLGTDRNH